MIRNRWKELAPMVLVFVMLNGLIIAMRSFFDRKGIDQEVVIIGNLVLFIVSVVAFRLTKKSLSNKNPHVFVRAVYTAFIVKFFIVVIGAIIYFQSVEQINKPALFLVLVLYLVYTFIEVSSLLRLLKGNKNV